MRKIRKILKPLLFAFSIILFVFIARLLLMDKVNTLDEKVFSIVTKIKCEPVTKFFKVITMFCSMWFVFLLTAIIMVFDKNKKKTFYIALNVVLCFLLNQVFKFIFVRERPDSINLINVNGYSFPSGHSMISVAFYGFLAYIVLHSNLSKKKRLLFTMLMIVLAFLVGISRIYLGVHYASDVLAGFALSLAYLIIYISVFYNEKKRI